jgi:hypothetical protein
MSRNSHSETEWKLPKTRHDFLLSRSLCFYSVDNINNEDLTVTDIKDEYLFTLFLDTFLAPLFT